MIYSDLKRYLHRYISLLTEENKGSQVYNYSSYNFCRYLNLTTSYLNKDREDYKHTPTQLNLGISSLAWN